MFPTHYSIYKRIIIQIWLMVLSLLVLMGGIFMLLDLKNYQCIMTGSIGAAKSYRLDDDGYEYCRVSVDTQKELVYYTQHGKVVVPYSSGYKVTHSELYLDFYEHKDGKDTYLKTIEGGEYEEIFYDLDYASRLKIIPRLENIKISYPSYRIWVPIILFLLSIPIFILSLYNTIIYTIEKVKKERESNEPIK